MQHIEFFVPIVPRGQARARSRVMRTKSGAMVAMHYTGSEQRGAADTLREAMAGHHPGYVIDGPTWIGLGVLLPIPASWSKRKKIDAISGRIFPTSRPDLDNVLKHVLDVMNGWWFGDDRQIVGLLPGTGKFYSLHPGYRIEISWRETAGTGVVAI